MIHDSKLRDKTTARSFAWLTDDEFVTEFYLPNTTVPAEVRSAPAVYKEIVEPLSGESHRVMDHEALHAFHQANCDMWEEDIDTYDP